MEGRSTVPPGYSSFRSLPKVLFYILICIWKGQTRFCVRNGSGNAETEQRKYIVFTSIGRALPFVLVGGQRNGRGGWDVWRLDTLFSVFVCFVVCE